MKKLIWEEDFNYEGSPKDEYWSYDLGPWKPNNELEYYTDRLENCFVKNGLLHIVARKEVYGERLYTSARIKTRYKVDIKYGRIDIKAKVPNVRGLWPAIWMMATEEKYGSWPKSGEIDIMEFVGGDDYIQSVLHTEGFNHRNKKQRIGFYRNFNPDVFHVFSLEWNKGSMKFYLDDELFFEVRDEEYPEYEKWQSWPFDEHFYLILNLAVGGNLGGKNGIDDLKFPQEFLIDYIKIYEIS